MAKKHRIISADGHTIEPPDMWERYVPKKFHDRIPRIVKDPMGGDAWEFLRGAPPMPIGLVTAAGKTYEQFHWYGSTYAGINQGCFLGRPRLEEQDKDGIDAEVLFPSQRTMQYFMANEDDAFHRAGIEAYNAWIYDEFSAPDRARLIPIAQMPNLGVETAVAELRQAKRHGFKGVVISAWPSGEENVSQQDEPFWAAAEQERMIVHIHGDILQKSKRAAPGSSKAAAEKVGGKQGLPSLAEMGGGIAHISGAMSRMIYAGIFDRYPALTVVGVEVGAGWIPMFLEHMNDFWWRNRTWTNSTLKLTPAEYYHRNWRVTFIKEAFAIKNRDAAGVGNIMWSTDYPHHGCDWPYSRRVIDEMFVNVPEADRRAIVCDNAAKLYGLV
ncbi:MAG: amidohydrolase [Chloroflexi bacterium]|nr:amidohydrolase [Chloroflexota bacterium]